MEALEIKHTPLSDGNKSGVFGQSTGDENSSSTVGERPHICNICFESFTTRENLEKHSLGHIGEGPFLCNICNKSISRQDLKRHSLLHRAEKPHVCNICNKSFAKKAVLNKHLIWHSGLRPYVCSVCNKTFTNKGHLDRHSLTHSGVKPHVCNICNKSFSQKWGLKKHVLTHREKRPYVCVICDEAFAVFEKLKEHAVIHYRKVPEKASKRVLYTIDKRESSQICSFCSKMFTENVCVKLLFSHQSGIDPYACKSCLKDFVEKISKGSTPVMSGIQMSIDPEKTNSLSYQGNQTPGKSNNVTENIHCNINDGQDANIETSFDVKKKCDDYEEITNVKEEYDIEFEEVNSSNIKKESDLGEVSDNVAHENHSSDSEELSSPDKGNGRVEFDVIYIDVKEETDVF